MALEDNDWKRFEGSFPLSLSFEDELGEGQPLGHLDWSILLPLKDQVIHGVTNYKTNTHTKTHIASGHTNNWKKTFTLNTLH